MSTEPLVLDLVEWVAARPRPYAEVIEAWRTSCPRLTVWEEASDRALIACAPAPDGTLMVAATEAGRLAVAARLSPAAPPSPSR
ncbi:hypothetical protein G3576_04820 [Roseomonas stagni]|uniref:Uncharacterized protein n=1 Tax=Falsiroseomonas algicola TaxID=2716930 RepID=A0A6M1LGP6_9PROT|nr:hypothetical protein [Falsiroseomonas algicola]NGM19327.1 hypothetical protein [Falsiroseomonas algicola]